MYVQHPIYATAFVCHDPLWLPLKCHSNVDTLLGNRVWKMMEAVSSCTPFNALAPFHEIYLYTETKFVAGQSHFPNPPHNAFWLYFWNNSFSCLPRPNEKRRLWALQRWIVSSKHNYIAILNLSNCRDRETGTFQTQYWGSNGALYLEYLAQTKYINSSREVHSPG